MDAPAANIPVGEHDDGSAHLGSQVTAGDATAAPHRHRPLHRPQREGWRAGQLAAPLRPAARLPGPGRHGPQAEGALGGRRWPTTDSFGVDSWTRTGSAHPGSGRDHPLPGSTADDGWTGAGLIISTGSTANRTVWPRRSTQAPQGAVSGPSTTSLEERIERRALAWRCPFGKSSPGP